MKLCVDCEHFGREVAWLNPNERGVVPVCKHPDFVNPVDGSFLPPGAVRKEKDLCGITGKGWKQRTTEEPENDPPPQKSRILTTVD